MADPAGIYATAGKAFSILGATHAPPQRQSKDILNIYLYMIPEGGSRVKCRNLNNKETYFNNSLYLLVSVHTITTCHRIPTYRSLATRESQVEIWNF